MTVILLQIWGIEWFLVHTPVFGALRVPGDFGDLLKGKLQINMLQGNGNYA